MMKEDITQRSSNGIKFMLCCGLVMKEDITQLTEKNDCRE